MILSLLGGKRKSYELKEYAIGANPEIDATTISNAINNKLTKLFSDDIISAIEAAKKTDGYDYYLTDEQKKAAQID